MAGTELPQLTPRDLESIKTNFSSPIDIPESFKAWLVSFLEHNPPRLMVSQMQGSAYLQQMLDVNMDTVAIADDDTETTVYSCLVPEGTLEVRGAVRVEFQGSYFNGTGGSTTLRLRIKYGGTTVYDDTTGNIDDDATDRGVELMFTLGNDNDTGEQKMAGHFALGQGDAIAAGYGPLEASGNCIPAIPIGGFSSEDSTLTQTLEVTIELGSADPDHRFDKLFAYTTRVAYSGDEQ